MTGVEDHSTKPVKTSPVIPFWMWAATALLLIFTVYTSWETIHLNKQIAETNAQADAELAKRNQLKESFALAQRQTAILTDANSVRILLVSNDKQFPKLEARWHATLGLVVSGQNVPMPGGSRTLQLWLIPKTPGGKPISSMTLRPDADGKLMLFVANPPEAIDATKALTLTEEPAGGSPQPTTKPIWLGAVN